jgi:hypothetical protein
MLLAIYDIASGDCTGQDQVFRMWQPQKLQLEKKKGSNNSSAALTTRSTPILNRLRACEELGNEKLTLELE